MQRAATATGLVLVLLVSGLTAARADDPATDPGAWYRMGRSQLQRGEFDAALASWQMAAQLAPKDSAYPEYALVLRRVIRIRKIVAAGTPSAKWERSVATLHAYYLEHEIHGEALALDRRVHALLENGASEARLAETLLATGRDPEAVALLSAHAPAPGATHHAIYLGIALARIGQIEKARALADGLARSAITDPVLLRERARLDTLLEDRPAALAGLRQSLAATPAPGLAGAKSAVLRCGDFSRLFGTPAFQAVMKTQSAVKATSCSGGSDCGSCPNRGGCGKRSGS